MKNSETVISSTTNKETFFKHPQALVESDQIGSGTRVWAFTHILPKARIGKDCNICDHVFIENDVVIGDRVTVKCGVQLWDGVTIEDDVFIGPNATFTNDIFPRSKKYPEKFLQTSILKGASVGANATILAGITIYNNAMVGAGAVVTKDVPQNAIVVGNPAKIIGYVNTTREKDLKQIPKKYLTSSTSTLPGNAQLIDLPVIKDLRGLLTFAEINKHLPFTPVRYFLVHDVPNDKVRGEHAHKQLEEFLVCIKGSCNVTLDDGKNAMELTLNSPNQGLYMPACIWSVQYKYSSDAILLVLASEIYEADDYIRNYDEFLQFINT